MKMRLLSVILLHGVCVLHLSALTVSAGELMEVKTISETPTRTQIHLLCLCICLSVTPDHKQFFSGSALAILTCVDGDGKTVDGWTVKRTRGTLTERCGAAEGLVIIKSLCQLKLRKPSDGAYFCESSSGQRSDEVNIIVSAGSRILKAPSFPVWTGSNEILLCQFKDLGNFSLYKVGEKMRSDPELKLTLTNVQKSDEGLYSCSTGVDQSPKSRLTVRDPPTDPPTDPPPNVKAHPGTGTGPHPLALLSQPPSCQVWFLWFSWFWFEFCSFGGS
uniref:Immunoglobulin domain-containing protein n=1 Tax=Astatotilapia calliptera TaxID=8154 RepID=A0AAX7SG77_ASTCA